MSKWERNVLVPEDPEEYAKKFPEPFSAMIPDEASGSNKLATEEDVEDADSNNVEFTEQTLTDAQKAQARTNIGAVSQAELEAATTQNSLVVASLPTASASTMGIMYLVGPDNNDEYARYVTSYDGTSYSWAPYGTTDINLAGYATTAQVSQLEAKVDENAIYKSETIQLDESSPYFVKRVADAYIQGTGLVKQNQYTTGYELSLFRLPAGTYILTTKTTATSGQAWVSALFDSEEDFVVGGYASSSVVVGDGTVQEVRVTFNEEKLLSVLWYQNFTYYIKLEKEETETLKEAVARIDLDVAPLSDIPERVDELEAEVDNALYEEVYLKLDKNSPYYVSEITDAYMIIRTGYPNGVIWHNNYTSLYSVKLFRVPAGKYKATYNTSYGTSRGIIVGTVASVSDFAVNGPLASKILESATDTEKTFTFQEETLVVLADYDNNEIGKLYVVENVELIPLLRNEVENIFNQNIDIVIPDTVYAIVGTELNIYNDAVSLSIDKGLHSPLNYQIRWACNKGTITDRCFRFTPASGDVGNVSCTCYLYDMRGVLVGSKTFTIKVLAKNALASAKNIVYFGDSLGANAATSLYDNFHDENRFGGTIPKMLGTKGTAKNYEAVGGYKWSSYATAGSTGYRISVNGVTSMQVGAVYSDGSHNFEVYEVNITEGVGNCLLGRHFSNNGELIMPSGTLTKVSGGGDASVPYTDAFTESVNPLWNDSAQKLDINQYKQTLVSLGQLSSVSDKIDAVSFQFGINDNALANDPDTLRGYISDLYNLFVGDNANCKFIVGLTTSSGNDVNGSGANYGATDNWKSYLENTYKIRKFYLSLLEDFPNMRIATPNLSLDRYYGYALGTRQVSNRCTETEQYHTNFVHPTTSGYWQIADAYLACYVGVLTES